MASHGSDHGSDRDGQQTYWSSRRSDGGGGGGGGQSTGGDSVALSDFTNEESLQSTADSADDELGYLQVMPSEEEQDEDNDVISGHSDADSAAEWVGGAASVASQDSH